MSERSLRDMFEEKKPFFYAFGVLLLLTVLYVDVGASTWASGNHVWNGHIGNFTANELKKANQSKY